MTYDLSVDWTGRAFISEVFFTAGLSTPQNFSAMLKLHELILTSRSLFPGWNLDILRNVHPIIRF